MTLNIDFWPMICRYVIKHVGSDQAAIINVDQEMPRNTSEMSIT